MSKFSIRCLVDKREEVVLAAGFSVFFSPLVRSGDKLFFCTKLLDVLVWSDFTQSNDAFEAFHCLWFDLDNGHILVLYRLDGSSE